MKLYCTSYVNKEAREGIHWLVAAESQESAIGLTQDFFHKEYGVEKESLDIKCKSIAPLFNSWPREEIIRRVFDQVTREPEIEFDESVKDLALSDTGVV